jgi:uncharacterized membrane protein
VEALHELLSEVTELIVLVINIMALLVIVYGTVEAFLGAVSITFLGGTKEPIFHPVWLRYARWLVAGLTFQLAADIIETSLAPSWEEIGKLAAIAAIRTFLNFFLGRDLVEVGREGTEAKKAI